MVRPILMLPCLLWLLWVCSGCAAADAAGDSQDTCDAATATCDSVDSADDGSDGEGEGEELGDGDADAGQQSNDIDGGTASAHRDSDGDLIADGSKMTGSGLISCGSAPQGSLWALLVFVACARNRRRAGAMHCTPLATISRVVTLLATVLVALLEPTNARATAREMPADAFLPAMDATGFLGVDSGQTTGQYSLDAAVYTGFLGSPLVLTTRDAAGDLVRVPVVERLFNAHIVGSVGIRDGLELGVVLPAALHQSRDQDALEAAGSYVGVPLAAQGLGDLHVRAKIALLRRHASGWAVAFLPTLTLPTSTAADAFLGEASAAFQPEMTASYDIDSVRLSANAGVRLRSVEARVAQLELHNEATFRAAVRWAVGLVPVDNGVVPIHLGFTVAGRAPMTDVTSRAFQTPLEAMVGVSSPVLPWLQVDAGFGVGVIGGYGAPDARVLVGVRLMEHDSDSDTVGDEQDRCPDEPEDLDSFEDRDGCPEPDNDRDGVLDGDDQCAMVPGVVAAAGCPLPDGDRDGVPDEDDACPSLDGSKAARGCPDQDDDGVPDTSDLCPAEPDVRPQGAASDGCPLDRWVKVRGRIIVPTEKLKFDVGGAGLRVETFKSLDHVARFLARTPEIRRVRVEGHCSDFDNEQDNQRTSEERARAVLAYLVRAGVEAERLDAMGHGASRPSVRGDSVANRERNRRVVLRIVGGEGPESGAAAAVAGVEDEDSDRP